MKELGGRTPGQIRDRYRQAAQDLRCISHDAVFREEDQVACDEVRLRSGLRSCKGSCLGNYVRRGSFGCITMSGPGSLERKIPLHHKQRSSGLSPTFSPTYQFELRTSHLWYSLVGYRALGGSSRSYADRVVPRMSQRLRGGMRSMGGSVSQRGKGTSHTREHSVQVGAPSGATIAVHGRVHLGLHQ